MADASDLLVLVADRNLEAAMRGILSRPRSLGTSNIVFDIRVHPRKDSGCCKEGVAYLRAFARQYRHALLVFDHQGCGRENSSATELESELRAQLQAAGWKDRACVIVLDPELEVWIWSDSPHVDGELGWKQQEPDLRTWLREQDLWPEAAAKPTRPKEALEAALRVVRKPRSSAIYKALAEKVSLQMHGWLFQ